MPYLNPSWFQWIMSNLFLSSLMFLRRSAIEQIRLGIVVSSGRQILQRERGVCAGAITLFVGIETSVRRLESASKQFHAAQPQNSLTACVEDGGSKSQSSASGLGSILPVHVRKADLPAHDQSKRQVFVRLRSGVAVNQLVLLLIAI